MTAAPRRDHSAEEPLLDALGSLADALARTSPRRVPVRSPGLLGALASLLTSSPPSTGPCFDKPKGTRR
ncbi:hypothetical protein ACRYCC_06120 [Actinomadura scrupuli]|uniref:hypothetical protein n=1 Tax=Actinomadura scrupuli TaxID=559629 RepID=UPI003D973309